MAQPKPLPLWDRQKGRKIEEWLDDYVPTYETKPQRSLTQWVQSSPLYDKFQAWLQNTRRSARKIEPFVRKYQIDMEEFEQRDYRSFSDFFLRRFRPGVRQFPSAPGKMGACAEGRYLAWERVDPGQSFPVKGHSLRAEHILGSDERARAFVGGPLILVRLAPVDYHHVHYPDSGRTLDKDRMGNRNWTVTWQALRNKGDILFRIERAINILETAHFGRLGLVEVGALTVGRIAQVHPTDQPFDRGQEKSMFRFGGSAVLIFGEPGAWRPSDDLLANTREGMETVIRLGETVATRLDTEAPLAAGTSRESSAQVR
ncbi:phosphatidylserine decarboxylase [Roseomonas sp. GCM10028921]